MVSGALAAALILLPADVGNTVEAYAPINAQATVAVAAVEEKVTPDSAVDLFSQVRAYSRGADESAQRGELGARSKPSGEDPVTAAVESVKIAEELDVTKLPEVHGPSGNSKKEASKGAETTAVTESGSKTAEASESVSGGFVDRLKSGGSKIAGSLKDSKQVLAGGGAKVRDFVGRIKDGSTGAEQSVPEAPAVSPAAPAATEASPGGVKGWLNTWTGKSSESGKSAEKAAQGGGLFGGGSQAVQPPAKSQGLKSFLQPKPPKEEKTGLAAAWESFKSLSFLPDNVKDGAITVKNVLSVILTVLSLVLTIFSKALGLAADLIGIIARGL